MPDLLNPSPPDAGRTETAPLNCLHSLLDESLGFGPEYGQGLSSHLPMALAALHGLGASEARMRSFFATQVRHLERDVRRDAVGTSRRAPDEWRALRGRIEAYPSLRDHFVAALRRQGRATVLQESLASLVSGVSAAAFHGLIRVAHAVESEHEGELASALAYWAARWVELPAPTHSASMDGVSAGASIGEWFDRIDHQLQREQAPWRPAAPLISGRMQEAVHTSAYHALAGGPGAGGRASSDLLLELAQAAAARYADTGNFTVLHLATGARAARVLAPWLPAGAATLKPLWRAVAAAWMAAAGRRVAVPEDMAAQRHPTLPKIDWQSLVRRARASNDEHVIKFVHAMVMQHREVPHPIWLRAASVALRAPN
jgi:hypothetical protein